jgi:hypothetical protein
MGFYISKLIEGNISMDQFFEELNTKNPYDFLAEYALFLKKQMKVRDEDLRQKGKIAWLFLKSVCCGIDIEEFKE